MKHGHARGLLAALLVAACGGEPDAVDLAPGVSLRLAEERAARLSDLRYGLRFRIPAERHDPILGEARIEFQLADARRPLALDFEAPAEAVRSVRVADDSVEIRHENGHFVLPPAVLREGANVVDLEFVAGDEPLNRTDEFLYTLFVPDRARRAFPAFDQPDLKARYSLQLELPPDWVAVANGAPVDSAHRSDGRLELAFAETEPLSSYLFAFAAGRFQMEEATRAGRTLRLYHRETDTAKVARNLEAIFDLHGAALEWLEAYTAVPYPFGKFDFVAVPSFQYNGMEHPGAVLYRASSLFLDQSATLSEQLDRARLIAHETAHMWFGDLVTMRWFDDVWMKEVFANFLAAKIVNPSFPDVDHEVQFLLAHYPPAYAVDRSAGANPIRQPLENLAEAGTLYGPIIYRKAPVVMKHLELLVSEDGLRDGLREYLDAFRFANAGWPELIAILDRRTSVDLVEWSRVWVEEPGRPTVEVRLSGGTVEVVQSDPWKRERRWTQPLQVLLGGGSGAGAHRSVAAPLDRPRLTLTVPEGEPPAFVLANGDGVGYGLFRLTEASRRYLLERLPAVEPAMPRAVAWLSLWDEMLEGAVEPTALVEGAERLLAEERDELIVARVLADLETAFWRFLDSGERDRRAPGLESLLWSRVESSASSSLKASFFRAFASVARTAEAVARLRAVWSGERAVDGLTLEEEDFTRLALELAVRDVPDSEAVLAGQLERIQNPDRRERFAFVRPALSADPAVRGSFFDSLRQPERRAREPWVVEALAYLHHPLRAAASIGYLQPSLELLEEIQRTGDIFFPQRWLGATLGGHASPEAAAIVRSFLEARPDYPERLRGKILQAADLLYRAADLP